MSIPVNILIDELPEYIEVDGIEYPINSSFRNFILFEQLISDAELSEKEKVLEMVSLLFPGERPIMTPEVVNAIVDFYRCGKQETRKQRAVRKTVKNKVKIYDFDWDDAYIYAAFMNQYHIDLNTEQLHWWKFKALFNGLSSECEFVKIMGYRGTDTAKIKDKAEKARILKLKALYALPDNLTIEQKAARIGAVLGGACR